MTIMPATVKYDPLFAMSNFCVMKWYMRNHSSSGILHAASFVTMLVLTTPQHMHAYTVTLLKYCPHAVAELDEAAGPCIRDRTYDVLSWSRQCFVLTGVCMSIVHIDEQHFNDSHRQCRDNSRWRISRR